MNKYYSQHISTRAVLRSAASWLFQARYLQPKDGHPDTRSVLSLPVPLQAIVEANRAVQEATI